MIAVVAAHVGPYVVAGRDRDRRTMAGHYFIQINIGAGDSVFAIVLGVFACKKLLGLN